MQQLIMLGMFFKGGVVFALAEGPRRKIVRRWRSTHFQLLLVLFRQSGLLQFNESFAGHASTHEGKLTAGTAKLLKQPSELSTLMLFT